MTTRSDENSVPTLRRDAVPQEPFGALLTTPEASRYLGVSKSWLDKSRLTGRGPAHYRVGRLIRYRIADLDRFVNESQRQSTSAAA